MYELYIYIYIDGQYSWIFITCPLPQIQKQTGRRFPNLVNVQAADCEPYQA